MKCNNCGDEDMEKGYFVHKIYSLFTSTLELCFCKACGNVQVPIDKEE